MPLGKRGEGKAKKGKEKGSLGGNGQG